MNIKIKEGLKNQSAKVRKHAGFLPYLYSLGGMALFALLYLGFVLINNSTNYGIYFLGFGLIILYMFVGLPFLYGVSVLTSNASRMNEEKNLGINVCFNKYFKGNPGFFSTGGIIFKGIFLEIASFIVLLLILEPIISYFYPDFVSSLYYIYANYEYLDFYIISEAMAEYSRLFEVFYIAIISLGNIPLFILVSSELRKNESVYYAANVLVADNYIDVATRPLIPLFRREILPLVKKEYRRYNYRLNYLGYIVFYVLYLGLTTLFFFMPEVSFVYAPFIAFSISILFYAPFYYRQRVFDSLFYIAYSDKIMERASDRIKQIIKAGRSQIMPKVEKFKDKEDEEESSDGFYDSNPDGKYKTGNYDKDKDEIDFTEKDNSDNDDKKDI